MKFIHTADWQVGMRAQSAGGAGSRVRDERLLAARRAVDAAASHAAEFIILAGDVFEDNAVDRLLVQKVADILAGFGGPVFIIPGNHDPLMPGSVWEHPAWRSSANVRVLRDEQPVDVPGGVAFPCPVREKHSGRIPTAWIHPERDGKVRLGIAHGTVEGVQIDEPDYPIPRDAAQQAALDYLALGHWHSHAQYPGPDGAARMAYSGTHEPTRFGERDSGSVLLVEIAGAGAAPAIAPVRTGCLTWCTLEEELRAEGDLARLRRKVEEMERPADTLIEVRISGVLAAAERGELDHLGQIIASRFLTGRLDVSQLRPSPADDSWLGGLPPGIVREAATRLREAPAATGTAPEAATRALTELYAIAQEVRQ